jgi:purine nucleosidase
MRQGTITMTKRMIILDCDKRNEIDDQFAITYALNSPSVQVEGVVSVQNQGAYGLDSVDIYHEEAQKILSLAGSKVPAFKGSRYPLKSVDSPASNEGVEFLIERAKALGRRLTIVGTGPATNISRMNYPIITDCFA